MNYFIAGFCVALGVLIVVDACSDSDDRQGGRGVAHA